MTTYMLYICVLSQETSTCDHHDYYDDWYDYSDYHNSDYQDSDYHMHDYVTTPKVGIIMLNA